MAESRIWYHELWAFIRDRKGVGFFAGGAILISFYLVQLQVGKSRVTLHSKGSPHCDELWEGRRKSYEIPVCRENEEMSNNSTVQQIQILLCASCPFAMRRGMTDINVTAWNGYGRTGNALISINKALNFAYTCKLTIQLPLHDIFQAFDIQPDHSKFDFRSRNGTIPRVCSDVSLPIIRRAAFFWKFPENVGVNSSDYKKAQNEIPKFELKNTCLRKYLGICEPHYCVFPPTSAMADQHNTIVGHVREGDIFPSNFSGKVHPRYGQPPLSYYLQAFAAYKKIVVVGQPGSRQTDDATSE